MSMPNFPEINPELTCESALNMILASIAMEELALSHIINAEGEKLQYVLGTLETNGGKRPDVDEVLLVNQSVTNLLDGVLQNQMILKNKMDKAIHALSDVCPGRAGPACKCRNKCSAVFTSKECRLWRAGSALRWDKERLNGDCVCYDPCDKAKIELRSKGRFLVHFAVNVWDEPGCKNDVAISLQMTNKDLCKELYVVRYPMTHANQTFTISMGGILVETSNHNVPSSLLLKLVSSDSLMVEDSMFSIVEV